MGSHLTLFGLLQEYLLEVRVLEDTWGWFISNIDVKKKKKIFSEKCLVMKGLHCKNLAISALTKQNKIF